ncbi:Dual specificity protein kinase TTK [Sciurus carolinensis]|uniref:Dual specificity protein kinase TTK n=1 Tax=Sciurus carolinensis TaxID=30640 RepID=A0AA41NDF5_SCICA|nr:Dual specificity protein kinase TTK [Sciurus carolinensis]
MDAEDLNGRELTIDSIMNKVRDIKNKFKNEDLTDELSLNKISADTKDNSGTVNQIMMMANNPEDWLNFLLKLEKNSAPLNDALLNKLIGRYSQAIEALPPDKYGQNESFARIQVRFAELKAIQEPDDARDYFQMARENCKKFAFVHISFAQFELSQGNFKKSKQLLHKAVESGAVPLEMLEIAICNLNLQKRHLLSEEEKKSLSGNYCVLMHFWSVKNIHSKEPLVSDEKNSELITDSITLKNKTESSLLNKLEEMKELQEPKVPESNQKQWQSKRKSECVNPNPVAFSNQWHIPDVTPKTDTEISGSSSTNECIAVKGRIYSILKQIGSGGSSKVYQVLNEKKQIYAIKYVNLEEADNQTIDSYRNEIAYLNKLQQHSDKIIRLYDYEITDQYIYMVMECGNIDLNSWLKKKKSINPWERKSYWKNMLEAVHTIHQHGIVHSDLKPANFLIVDGMLKLIDFGIANQMQPDTTSIVKDSQVGTVNYMPPEAIKDMSSSRENGKSKSKISPKSDVWSLGCILYYMTYGKTPFQHIINQISKLHAIIDPNHDIEFPDIPEKDLQDVLKCCLVRDPKQRISIPELLAHPYVQIQIHPGNQMAKGATDEMKYVLGQLVGLNSPNSILKAAKVSMHILYISLNCFVW